MSKLPVLDVPGETSIDHLKKVRGWTFEGYLKLTTDKHSEIYCVFRNPNGGTERKVLIFFPPEGGPIWCTRPLSCFSSWGLFIDD